MEINEVVRGLHVGDESEIRSNVAGVNPGIVIRVEVNSFSFHIQGTLRRRWGNRQEISQDIEHFINTGALPPYKGQSWA